MKKISVFNAILASVFGVLALIEERKGNYTKANNWLLWGVICIVGC